ncbi:MAG TPA: family 43 glycosylhydrolase [Tepidisphaeraceae bacterium]|jgi:GH43 family beta-xylosidase
MPDPVQLPPTCYLFASCRDDGHDGLRLAYSTDGLTWTALNQDRSYLKPLVGTDKLMRNPCLARGPDGTFHMVWTDSRGGRTIGYAQSSDLINWSPQRALPVMEHEPTARNCWAPEVVFDTDTGHFLIHWSTTLPGRFVETEQAIPNAFNHRIYCTTTQDFVSFTPTRLLYDGGFSAIDATILKDTDRYHLFVKDDTQGPTAKQCLHVAHGDTLEGPYTNLSAPITGSGIEGPTALRVGEYAYVYYADTTRQAQRAIRTKDFKSWEDVTPTVQFSPDARHGSVIPVPAAIVRGLLSAEATTAPQPLYRDPVHDGAADPVVIWNRQRRLWFMLYTNRRANVPDLEGVAWVHGTRVGIASSPDGRNWTYEGTADIDYGGPDDAHWAPDAFFDDGHYHMFLSVVPGLHTDWNAERRIVYLTSPDLLHWGNAKTINLSSDRVLDASLLRTHDGTWRMWYNDERDNKSIHVATSADLLTWKPLGRLEANLPPGEGPKAFRWRGAYWLIVDHWNGLGVARSDDGIQWTPQPQRLLSEPGFGKDDAVVGHHADVVVNGDKAYLFYFTHPGRRGAEATKDGYEQRRSSIQVVELTLNDAGQLVADRDRPTALQLVAPTDVVPTTNVAATAPAADRPWPNPLVYQRADPWALRHTDGLYYFTASVPEYDRIELRSTARLADLGKAEPKVIWRKHDRGEMGNHIWAPELHWIDDRWYIYFAAGRADQKWAIRIYVLANESADPLKGEWKELGQLKTQWETFCLDAHTFVVGGQRYLAWAQTTPEKRGTDLYLSRMKSPTELIGPQVAISAPDLPWERRGHRVNEGPAVIERDGRVFMTYSASATDANYCMGLLTADVKADLMDPKSWAKSPRPVFTSNANNSIYGPGHNSFTKSEDGVDDLLVYHARSYRDIIGEPLYDPNRHTRVQKMTWAADGTPVFGTPVKDD